MKKQVPEQILFHNAPKAVGPYSQAVKAGMFLFLSGQIGIDPKTGTLQKGIIKQTEQIMKNITNMLHEQNLTVKNVVKTTIYITQIKHFNKVNALYGSYFNQHKPARVTIEVPHLPKNALIEIDAICYLG